MRSKLITTFLLLIFSCFSVSAATIRVGSRDFPESVLVAEILSRAIESKTKHQVERDFHLGGVKVCVGAMQADKLDLYPDYTGSLMHNLLGEYSTEEYLDNYLRSELNNQYGFKVSQKLGYDNSFVLAVRRKFAEKYKLENISDLAALLQKGKVITSTDHSRNSYMQGLRNEDKGSGLSAHKRGSNERNAAEGDLPVIRAGFKHSFIKRPDGYGAIQKAYGIDFKQLMPMEYNLAYQNLKAGRIDVIDAFSTDSRLYDNELFTLKDDKHALLNYDAVFVSRKQSLQESPELKQVIKLVEQKLSNTKILELNERIHSGETYKSVADSFLTELGIETKEVIITSSWQQDFNQIINNLSIPENIKARIKQDTPILAKALAEHISLALAAALLASLIGLFIGIVISYNAQLASIVLSINSVVQTIPTLALLALMIPLLGLGFLPSVVALIIYALLPVIQNTYTGITNISPEYIALAESLALKEQSTLLKIKLPMAKSMIIAGIRTASVICVGAATLATFVGGGGLGDLIKAGMDLNSNYMIMLGALPAAALALVANYILKLFEDVNKRV